jgi:LPS export ABC transporter protein LptC
MRHVHTALVISLCAALALAFCAGSASCTGKRKNIPQSGDSIAVPYQEFGPTTMYCYDGPYKIWRLETEYMRKNISDTAKMLAIPVVITMYDSQGVAGTRILADSGNTTKELRNFDIWGNVYIKTHENLRIKSQSLWWDKETHKVGSDDFVEITTPEGDVLRGKGLDANESFSRWSLRKSVSGTFPNFRERMESEDESDTKD